MYGRPRGRTLGLLSALPRAKPGVPNVLLLVMDTVRGPSQPLWLPARDHTQPGSVVAQGVRFDQARSTAPWTLPSHASMFTGKVAAPDGRERRRSARRGPSDARRVPGRPAATSRRVRRQHLLLQFLVRPGRGFSHYEDFYDEDLAVSITETLRCSRSAGAWSAREPSLGCRAGGGRMPRSQS